MRMPVAVAASSERSQGGTVLMRAIGRPMKIVDPAIAPRRSISGVLISL
jgi:hypothetical protein